MTVPRFANDEESHRLRLEEIRAMTRGAAAESLELARTTPAPKARDAAKAARAYGIDPSSAPANLMDPSAKAQLMRESGPLSAWMGLPSNAAQVQDDLPAVNSLAELLESRAYGRPGDRKGAVGKAASVFGAEYTRVNEVSTGQFAQNLRGLVTGTVDTEEMARLSRLNRELTQRVERDSDGLLGIVSGAAKVSPSMIAGLAGTAKGAALAIPFGAALGAAGGGAAGGPAAPLTGAAGAAAGGAAAATIGGTIGGIFATIELEAGNKFGELMEARTTSGAQLDVRTAAIHALGVGIFNGTLEYISNRFTGGLIKPLQMIPGYGKLFPAAIKTEASKAVERAITRPTTRAAVASFAKGYIGGAAIEVGTEVLQSVPGGVSNMLLDVSNPDGTPYAIGDLAADMWDSAKQTAEAMVLLGLPGPIVGLAVDAHRAEKAEATRAFFANLAETAKTSKVIQEAPETAADMIRTIAPDAGNVYIPAEQWESYFQGIGADPVEAAQEILGDAGQYVTATETGGGTRTLLAIPMDVFATKLAGTPFYEATAEHLKRNPNDLSAAEMKTANREIESKFDEAIKDSKKLDLLLQEFDTVLPTQADGEDALRAEYEAALVQAGRPQQEAAAIALIVGRVFRSMAARSSQSLEAMQSSRDVTILGGQAAQDIYATESVQSSLADARGATPAAATASQGLPNPTSGTSPAGVQSAASQTPTTLQQSATQYDANGVAIPAAPNTFFQTPGALPEWSKEPAGVSVTKEMQKAAISLAPKAALAGRNYEKMDAIFEAHPNPLASADAWRAWMASLVGDENVLGVPYVALKYATDPQAVADYLLKLRPDQIESRRAGFKLGADIQAKYQDGSATPLVTGRLLLWGILSRKAGAYPHESAYMDLVNGGVDQWIEKALAGEWTKADTKAYTAWSRAFMAMQKEGVSPSAGVTSNANDFGRVLLTKLSKRGESGVSKLEELHNMMSDPSQTTDAIRRAFFALGDGLGIQNKVLSFAMLVTGRLDTLVLDRVQFTHLWGDTYRERAGEQNIYDDGLAEAGEGHFGVAVYEGLARGMTESIKQGYALAGMTGPGDGTLGAFHWDSWLGESSQAIGHPSLAALTTERPAAGLAVRQGKFDTINYNFEYRADGQYQIPLLDGSGYRLLSAEEASAFADRLRDSKEGVVPADFAVSENKSSPWVDAAGVDRARYDAILNEFGRRLDAADVAAGQLATRPRFDTSPADRQSVLAARRARAGSDGGVQPYTRASVGSAGGFRLLTAEKPATKKKPAVPASNTPVATLATYTPARSFRAELTRFGAQSPVVHELNAKDKAAVAAFMQSMKQTKKKSAFGAAVTVYSAAEYRKMRLFISDDGTAGIAIKRDGDIVSGFSQGGGVIDGMLELAISEGGIKLDCYDTVLPKIYGDHGFVESARLKWDDSQAKKEWDKATFAEFNNGEPDVVLMHYDPQHDGTKRKAAVVATYDDAVAAQDAGLAEVAARPVAEPLGASLAGKLLTLFQRAFHGSPFNFDRFSLDAIGSGEGAQAFGWGLYFASKKAIADWYRTTLLSRKGVRQFGLKRATVNGERIVDLFPEINQADAVLLRMLEEGGGAALIEYAEEKANDLSRIRELTLGAYGAETSVGYYDRAVQSYQGLADAVRAGGVIAIPEQQEGQLFEVSIPDDDQLLIWDKPLAEQPKIVQDAIAALGYGQTQVTLPEVLEGMDVGELIEWASSYDRNSSWDEVLDESPDMTADELRAEILETYDDEDMTAYLTGSANDRGKTIYESLALKEATASPVQGAGTASAAQREVSLKLLALGVRGIRYLDNFSRGQARGEEAFNYVVFSEDDVAIEQTFYQGEQDANGFIQFSPDGHRVMIGLLKTANKTTALHEFGHLFAEMLLDSATKPGANASLVEDAATIRAWLGVPEGRLNRAQHEQFAEAFEAYLERGKAPSLDLAKVFGRFRAWFSKVFADLKRKKVELSPEIIAVFDRMIAGEDAIATAEEDLKAGRFTSAEQGQMTPEQWATYQEHGATTREAFAAKLHARLQQETVRETRAFWNEEREKRGKATTERLQAMPVYKALAAIKAGDLLPRSWVKEIYAGEIAETLVRRRMTTADEDKAVNPTMFALEHGFASEGDMIAELATVEPLERVVAREVDEQMKEAYPNLEGGSPAMAQAVQDALHDASGDRSAQLLAEELEALGRVRGIAVPATVNKSPLQQVRALARQVISRQQVGQLQPHLYLVAERKAAREVESALTSGKQAEAIAAKRRQLLNHLLYSEAVAAQAEAREGRALLLSYTKTKVRAAIGKIGQDWLEQIDGLLEKFDLTTRTADERMTIDAFILWKQEDGNQLVTQLQIGNTLPATPWKSLTVQQMRDAVTTVSILGAGARNEGKAQKLAKDMDTDMIVSRLITELERSGRKAPEIGDRRSPTEKRAARARGWIATLRTLPSLVRELGGGREDSAWWTMILRPLNEAQLREAQMLRDSALAMEQIVPLLDDSNMLEKKPVMLSDGRTKMMTLRERLAVVLNTGTEGNQQRLADGNLISYSVQEKVRQDLTDKELQFVQAVWDFLDAYWPETEALAKRLDGIAPEKVEAIPFVVRGKQYRGGYYRIKYDPVQDARQAEIDLENIAKDYSLGSAFRGVTKNGSRIERLKNVQSALLLDLSVIGLHTQEVIHDLTHAELMRDMSTVFKRRELGAVALDTVGIELWNTVKKTLAEVTANGRPMESGDAVFSLLSRNVGLVGMGFNVMTALLQPTGFLSTANRIGIGWTLHGLAQATKSTAKFENVAALVREKSELMAVRWDAGNRDAAAALSATIDVETIPTAQRVMMQYAYFGIAKMQIMVDAPTWLGAYQKYLADGMPEATAIKLADQAVTDSQGGGMMADRSDIMRRKGGWQVFTAMHSYMNTQLNLLISSNRIAMRETDTLKMSWQITCNVFMLVILPAVLTKLLRDAIKGEPPDDEKMKTLSGEVIAYTLGMFPVLREASGAFQGFRDYDGPAGTRLFASFQKFGQQAVKVAEGGDVTTATLRAGNEAAGLLFGYPSAQIDRTVRGIAALSEGRFDGALEAVRLPFFGPPRTRR